MSDLTIGLDSFFKEKKVSLKKLFIFYLLFSDSKNKLQ